MAWVDSGPSRLPAGLGDLEIGLLSSRFSRVSPRVTSAGRWRIGSIPREW